MKILSTAQIRAADAHTIQNEPIASIDLMERASQAFVEEFQKIVDPGVGHIFCGTGNNGGDGLAIGRLLSEAGYQVHIYAVGNSEKVSDDFAINLERLNGKAEWISEIAQIGDIHEADVIIDALLGSGLTRRIEGVHKEVIDHINQLGVKVVSVDIASGLHADHSVGSDATIVKPDHTITFQVPPLAFFLPGLSQYVGEFRVVDIGLDASFIASQETDYQFTDASDIRPIVPSRGRFDHKGSAGRALLIAGSKGKMGAATLSASACMRAGAGLLFARVPGCGLDIMQISVPEAMVVTQEVDEVIEGSIDISGMDAIGIGPGLGQDQRSIDSLSALLANGVKVPLVVDADGLNILAKYPEMMSMLPEGTVLTPHPGEFQRLVGAWNDDFEKLDMLKAFARKYRLNVVLKGAYSAVCDQWGKVWFNSSGNPGMATAGSGDVLLGVVLALLAQRLAPFDALRLGVYLHGLAGDIAAESKGEVSLIASDLIASIPGAYRKLTT